MTPEIPLPPSLAATPNIQPRDQTLEQLRLEAAYWQSKLDSAAGWGASVGFASSQLRACNAWIARKENRHDT